MVALIVLSFFTALAGTLLLVRGARRHARGYPSDLPQRFHFGHVPRLGGLAVLLGTAAGWLATTVPDNRFIAQWPLWQAGLAVAALLPAVAAGAVEDVTQRVPVRWRLGLTLLSAVLLCAVLGLSIARVGVPAVDGWLVAAPWLATAFAVMAIGGLPHAFNLIDGYNGLAGMVAVLICGALAHVALQVGDRQLAAVVLALAGSTAGFLAFNYPRGKIFAGDSGAYVWGLVIAVVCVALVQRHPGISPWFPVLLLIYPVCETLFSIYRKAVRGQSPGSADALHFHQLIFRRIVRRLIDQESRSLLARNNRTSPFLWAFCALAVVPAVIFRNHTPALMALTALFVVSYVTAYLMIVRFKVPRWLRV